MKKLMLTTLILLTAPACAFALDTEKVLNLHTNSSYILDLDKRPMDLQVTNPRILEAEATSDIFTEQSQLMLTTSEEGISYVTFKQGKVNHTLKILIDDNEKVDDSVIEIDTIKEPAAR